MTGAERVLVVDDDDGVVALWVEVLRRAGLDAEGMTDPVRALERAEHEPFDLVLTDVEMPGLRGTELLRRLLAARPEQLVVLITAFGSIPAAVEALHNGAADFVSKPCSPDTLVHVVRRALRERWLRREVVRLRRRASEVEWPGGVVAESPAMRRVLELADRVAHARGPVLLQGESGTGKTSLAQYIHARGPRAAAPFRAINAATLPEQLAEAELFGVTRGAYTDAVQDRLGLLRAADGGSVFLDEVTELPPGVQTKLLTFVEAGVVRPVGSAQEVAVDVRLIAASNMDLSDAVQRGTFRADLRFRLDVLTIRVPPLRERTEDIAPLVDLWLSTMADRSGQRTMGVSAAGWRWLHAWRWPGNVRELFNRLERAVVFADRDVIGPDDLEDPPNSKPGHDDLDAALARAAGAAVSMTELEARYLRAALRAAGGNKSEAARLLGIDRSTVYRKLDELG